MTRALHLACDVLQPSCDIGFCLAMILLHEHRTNKLVHCVLRRELVEFLSSTRVETDANLTKTTSDLFDGFVFR
jgi:hypothetical protein